MSRELKRVPLDFDWPLNKVWKGYEDPHVADCPLVKEGRCIDGVTIARRYLRAIVNLLVVAGDDAFNVRRGHTNRILPHPYFNYIPDAPDQPATEDMLSLIEGLAGQGPSLMGFDSIAAIMIERRIVRAAKLSEKWGLCPVCEGHGDDPATRAASEAWEPEEPPQGEGWQVWETVTEGSPISPVLPTREDLIEWLMLEEGCSRLAAERFCEGGFAPTGMLDTRTGRRAEGVQALDLEGSEA